MPYVGNYLGVNNRNGSLRQFAARECEQRKGRGSDHRDILSALMDVKEGKPKEFDDNGVLSMAASNIFAGSDTTGISIGAVLYNLCKNPECKEKLLKEIKETLQNEGLDASENMPFKIGHSMPYLQACIYEALRMHPAVGMSLPRVVPQEGFEIDGTFIPAGVSSQFPNRHIFTHDQPDDNRCKPLGHTSTKRDLRRGLRHLPTRTMVRRRPKSDGYVPTLESMEIANKTI